ncbi:MAG: hydantoinase B/oxoprolinase family protein [bacterium]
MKFDPISLEVIWRRLIGLVDEAAATLVRTAFSTLVKESNDFSCVLTDDRGESLVQCTASIPSFIGTLPITVRHFLREFPPEQLSPGDVLVTNDIWYGTGHLPDVNVAKPIFHRGRFVGFAASTAHLPDIGGKIRSPDPQEVYEEGLQIPIMKLYRAGEANETLIRLIRYNVRVPDLVMGDIYAQVTANGLAEGRLAALLDEYGLEDLRALTAEIQGRSEGAMRGALRAVPDGVYTSALETDGLAEPIRIRARLEKKGDALVIDYEGSSPQVDRALNVASNYTYAYSVYPIKCALCPEVPNNEGCFRPIEVRAPEGSILNPRRPAPGGGRMLVGHYLPAAVFAALAPVMPERVAAASGSPLWCVNYSGPDKRGERTAGLFFQNGGTGATARREGHACLSFPSNVSNTPIEALERITPFTFLEKTILRDSGGEGRRRGGCGQRIVMRNDSPGKVTVSFMAERTRRPAPGLYGGGEGAPGQVLINGEAVNPKETTTLQAGDILTLITPGGGGYGPPEGEAEGPPGGPPEGAEAGAP